MDNLLTPREQLKPLWDFSHLKPGDKGTFSYTQWNSTVAYFDYAVKNTYPDLMLILCIIETVLNWFYRRCKNDINSKNHRHYYVIYMIIIFQSCGAFFSFLAMEGKYTFKILLAQIVGVLFASTALYYGIAYLLHRSESESNMQSFVIYHKTKINNKTLVFLFVALVLMLLMVYISYLSSPKKPTLGDGAKLFGLAVFPVISLVIPLIISKYCDALLNRLPNCMACIILSISGYKQLKFDGTCNSVLTENQSPEFPMEEPGIEIFGNKNEQLAIIVFVLKDQKKFFFKCFGSFVITESSAVVNIEEGTVSTDGASNKSVFLINDSNRNVLVIENANQLPDGREITVLRKNITSP